MPYEMGQNFFLTSQYITNNPFESCDLYPVAKRKFNIEINTFYHFYFNRRLHLNLTTIGYTSIISTARLVHKAIIILPMVRIRFS